MTHLKAIVFILIGLAIIVLVVQNNAALSTTVKFRMNPYFFQEKMTSDITLYEIVIVTYLLGVLSIGLYGITERFRLKKKIKVLTRTLEEREKEVNNLRNLPITSDHVPPSRPDAA
ncbi:MAG TPA: LapA family protein [Desulfatiglandales bacterium]